MVGAPLLEVEVVPVEEGVTPVEAVHTLLTVNGYDSFLEPVVMVWKIIVLTDGTFFIMFITKVQVILLAVQASPQTGVVFDM